MQKLSGEQAVSTVSVTKTTAGQPVASSSETKAEGEATLFDQPTANVGFKAGRTINLGNYNSVKIEVSLFMPCYVNSGELESTFKFAAEWVDAKLNEVMGSINETNS